MQFYRYGMRYFTFLPLDLSILGKVDKPSNEVTKGERQRRELDEDTISPFELSRILV